MRLAAVGLDVLQNRGAFDLIDPEVKHGEPCFITHASTGRDAMLETP